VIALDPDSSFVLTRRILAAGADDAVPTVSDRPFRHSSEPPEPSLSPLRARRDGFLDL
jgi:hypothetical protein